MQHHAPLICINRGESAEEAAVVVVQQQQQLVRMDEEEGYGCALDGGSLGVKKKKRRDKM